MDLNGQEAKPESKISGTRKYRAKHITFGVPAVLYITEVNG